MAYTPTVWKDRVVEKPRTYQIQDNGDGTVTLVPVPGTIHEAGTPVNAVNLNKIENGIKAAHDIAESHAARTNNPHAVTKAQVGLGNVPNYPAATQAQAEAGADNASLMTPLRTKQYTDTRLLNNLKFRINSGVVEFWNGTGWQPVGGIKSVQRGVTAVSDSQQVDVTISPVDINKSFVVCTFMGNISYNNHTGSYAELVNSTTLRLHRSSGAYGGTYPWQVIEFY